MNKPPQEVVRHARGRVKKSACWLASTTRETSPFPRPAGKAVYVAVAVAVKVHDDDHD
jgi:hypothetical protein